MSAPPWSTASPMPVSRRNDSGRIAPSSSNGWWQLATAIANSSGASSGARGAVVKRPVPTSCPSARRMRNV